MKTHPTLLPHRTRFARLMTRLGLHRWYVALETGNSRFSLVEKCAWCHAMRPRR